MAAGGTINHDMCKTKLEPTKLFDVNNHPRVGTESGFMTSKRGLKNKLYYREELTKEKANNMLKNKVQGTYYLTDYIGEEDNYSLFKLFVKGPDATIELSIVSGRGGFHLAPFTVRARKQATYFDSIEKLLTFYKPANLITVDYQNRWALKTEKELKWCVTKQEKSDLLEKVRFLQSLIDIDKLNESLY